VHLLFGSIAAAAWLASQISEKTIERLLGFAQPGSIYSAPVVSGPYTIITASEVVGGGGFGYGSGPATGAPPAASSAKARQPKQGVGGGRGGGYHSRPVAAIVIGAGSR